jgi:hypothetical protein
MSMGIARLPFALLLIVGLAVPALCDSISNINFVPTSPTNLPFGQDVTFTFNYDLSQPGQIFGRPFFAGSLRTDYAAHPSSLYPAGTGSAGGFFTIVDVGQGVAVVDQVRLEILVQNQTVQSFVTFVPVNFTFGSVPEPGAVVLLSLGLLSVMGLRRSFARKPRR